MSTGGFSEGRIQTRMHRDGASHDRPLAFVFAGGGSLGAVEVGMLRALVAARVAPDLVVGSSAGAINAVYFASEPDARGVEKLAAIWRGLRRQDVFPVSGARGALALLGHTRSLVDPSNLRRLLERNLRFARLEQSVIPAHVVATDLVSGEERVLSTGSSVEALLASAAIPAIFPPVAIAESELVDGGIANNTPLSAAVELGARSLVVLPTGFSCDLAAPPRGPLAVALHALNLLIARQLRVDARRLGAQVPIHVVPPLCPLARAAYDFSGTEELISRAEASTHEWLRTGGLERREIPIELGPHAHA